jgi:hypothetical protein
MPHPISRQGGEFPDLRIIPLDDLLLHEEEDLERVARLIDRLSADGVLRNPPIVASLNDSHRFMLLDGANRVSALRNLEVPHVLVQVEPYREEDLVIAHWNHVVRDIEAKIIVEKAKSMTGVTVKKGRLEDRDVDRRPDYLCTVALDESKALYLHGNLSLSERVHRLRELTQIYYRGPARMDRVNHADFQSLRHHYTHFGAVILFPSFSKEDIRQIAEAGDRLPSGVTRILVPRRVLGFNLQLALLKSHLPLEEKRRWLGEAINEKVAENKVRYYQEPTFVFND